MMQVLRDDRRDQHDAGRDEPGDRGRTLEQREGEQWRDADELKAERKLKSFAR